MSTLAAARADNFYYPKDWDPSKESLQDYKLKKKYKNDPKKLQKIEEKRKRKNEKNEKGEQMNRSIRIRFEVPFHIKCEGCEEMIAKGYRFNATKKHVGYFHTTKVFKFIMNCDYCLTEIVCQTDPEHCEYRFIEGAKKWLDQEKAQTDVQFLREEQEKYKVETNALFKLEVKGIDEQKGEEGEDILQKTQKYQSVWKNDFQLNQMMRSKLKEEKKKEVETKNPNFTIKLGKLQYEDKIKAEQVFKNRDGTRQKEIQKMRSIKGQSIFGEDAVSKLYAKIAKLPQNTRDILKKQLKK